MCNQLCCCSGFQTYVDLYHGYVPGLLKSAPALLSNLSLIFNILFVVSENAAVGWLTELSIIIFVPAEL